MASSYRNHSLNYLSVICLMNFVGKSKSNILKYHNDWNDPFQCLMDGHISTHHFNDGKYQAD